MENTNSIAQKRIPLVDNMGLTDCRLSNPIIRIINLN